MLFSKVVSSYNLSQTSNNFLSFQEIFCQTNLMLAILSSASRCCDQMEILIPSIGRNDLEQAQCLNMKLKVMPKF